MSQPAEKMQERTLEQIATNKKALEQGLVPCDDYPKIAMLVRDKDFLGSKERMQHLYFDPSRSLLPTEISPEACAYVLGRPMNEYVAVQFYRKPGEQAAVREEEGKEKEEVEKEDPKHCCVG